MGLLQRETWGKYACPCCGRRWGRVPETSAAEPAAGPDDGPFAGLHAAYIRMRAREIREEAARANCSCAAAIVTGN